MQIHDQLLFEHSDIVQYSVCVCMCVRGCVCVGVCARVLCVNLLEVHF